MSNEESRERRGSTGKAYRGRYAEKLNLNLSLSI